MFHVLNSSFRQIFISQYECLYQPLLCCVFACIFIAYSSLYSICKHYVYWAMCKLGVINLESTLQNGGSESYDSLYKSLCLCACMHFFWQKIHNFYHCIGMEGAMVASKDVDFPGRGSDVRKGMNLEMYWMFTGNV